jgi:TonB-dependent SusC/RagA subfamily outer membrane receptor
MKVQSLTFTLVLVASAACAPARTGGGVTATEPLVTAEEVARYNTTVEQLIQRKVSGVTVTRVGGDIGILIRGSTGYDDTDRPPLYVLNGSPFRPGPGGALTGVDPYEILSIRVLKGGDAALYGIDAANGVIEIRTKGAGTRTP